MEFQKLRSTQRAVPLLVGDNKRCFIFLLEKDRMQKYRYFDVEQRGPVTEIHLADTKFFDTERYAELLDELLAFVEQERPRRLLVNLSRVGYCSTAVIGALIAAQTQLEAHPASGAMKLCGASDVVEEALRRLKLDQGVFDIHSTEVGAIHAF
jgi:anti-anti-sigma regulatory factor